MQYFTGFLLLKIIFMSYKLQDMHFVLSQLNHYMFDFCIFANDMDQMGYLRMATQINRFYTSILFL